MYQPARENLLLDFINRATQFSYICKNARL